MSSEKQNLQYFQPDRLTGMHTALNGQQRTQWAGEDNSMDVAAVRGGSRDGRTDGQTNLVEASPDIYWAVLDHHINGLVERSREIRVGKLEQNIATYMITSRSWADGNTMIS